MSRIPASPQHTSAPAPLPAVAKATATAIARPAGQTSAAQNLPQTTPVQNSTDQVSLEKRGGSMSHYHLGLDAPNTIEPVTKAETQWALKLEDKVIKGYQPSAQEFEKYTDIATRLSDSNPARQIKDDENLTVKTLQKPQPNPTNQGEIKWALHLEERVKQGYQPTAEETAAYEKIHIQLASQAPLNAKISEKDLKWAERLIEKVGQGHQPSAEEMKRYEGIYAESQKSIESKPQSAESKSVQWAKGLEAKIQQGYQPSAGEVKRYTDIYERLQQGIK